MGLLRAVVQCSIFVLLCSIAVAGGCGTLAPPDLPAEGLPSSGVGPFRKLDDNAVILSDSTANLDDAQLLTDRSGGGFTVFHTRRADSGAVTIRRARFTALDDRDPSIDTLDLGAGAASQPAVLPPASPGGLWLLCFARAGGIRCATSHDGDRFEPVSDLTVEPNGAEEGRALASPALLRLAPSRARLVYLAGDSVLHLFAADLPLFPDGGPPSRLDADPSTPARDPILRAAAAPWLRELGRATARTLQTPAGRPRHDLYVSGVVDKTRVVGLAASFDAFHFTAADAPFLDPKAPDEWAPSADAFAGGTLLVFTTRSVGRGVLAVATGP